STFWTFQRQTGLEGTSVGPRLATRPWSTAARRIGTGDPARGRLSPTHTTQGRTMSDISNEGSPMAGDCLVMSPRAAALLEAAIECFGYLYREHEGDDCDTQGFRTELVTSGGVLHATCNDGRTRPVVLNSN